MNNAPAWLVKYAGISGQLINRIGFNKNRTSLECVYYLCGWKKKKKHNKKWLWNGNVHKGPRSATRKPLRLQLNKPLLFLFCLSCFFLLLFFLHWPSLSLLHKQNFIITPGVSCFYKFTSPKFQFVCVWITKRFSLVPAAVSRPLICPAAQFLMLTEEENHP